MRDKADLAGKKSVFFVLLLIFAKILKQWKHKNQPENIGSYVFYG